MKDGKLTLKLLKKLSGDKARELLAGLTYGDNGVKGVTHWQWAIFALLQVFNLYQLLTHAMWRDELQTWSLVRESNSILDLFHNMRYDGFPPLWYLSLWGLSFISTTPLAMQLFHFSCSVAAQFLVMKHAPFPGAMKLAIVAGYYFSFEYCIISRAYVLGVLLLFIFCAFHEWLAKHQVMRGGLLGLLANTSVYGAIVSLAFVADDLRLTLKKTDGAGIQYRAVSAANMAVYGLFLMVAVAFMLPPADGTYASGYIFNPNLNNNLFALCRNLISIIPVPVPKMQFWNSLMAHDAGGWIAIPVSLAVSIAIWLALRASPRYLGVFITGFIGIWIFTVVKYFGTIRHVGIAMVLFIACIWLATESNKRRSIVTSPWSAFAFWCILCANLFAFGLASYYHLKYEFSGSREMAHIIQRTSPSTTPIVGDADYAASSVAGYLGRPVYYVTNRKAQTFIRWNAERSNMARTEEVLNFAGVLSASKNHKVLLLLNYPMEFGKTRLLASSGNAIVADEVFYLYAYE